MKPIPRWPAALALFAALAVFAGGQAPAAAAEDGFDFSSGDEDSDFEMGGEETKPPPAKPAPAPAPGRQQPAPAAPARQPPATRQPPAPQAPPPAAAPAAPKAPATGTEALFEQEEKAGGPMEFSEGMEVGEVSPADRKRMELALQAMKEEKYLPAAVAMHDILKSPAAGLHPDAEYNLGKALYKSELYRSSLVYFTRIVVVGTAHKQFEPSLEWLFLLNRKLVDKDRVLGAVAKFENLSFPEKLRDEFNYLLARYYILKGNYDQAKGLILQVREDSPFYAKARFLEGMIQFMQRDFEGAVETLKQVVHLTNPEKGRIDDPVLRQQAFLNLARIHYAHQQFNGALFYYQRIEFDAADWISVKFEESWALFRLGRYGRSLGNLLTLHSPYFASYYNPESYILKAVNYYENCRYAEAANIANAFIARFNIIQQNLEKETAKTTDPVAFYTFVIRSSAMAAVGGEDTYKQILGLAVADHAFRIFTQSIGEIDKEIEEMKKMPEFFRVSALHNTLVEELKKERQILVKAAGTAAREAFIREAQNIKDLIGQAYRVRLETISKMKEEQMAVLRGSKIGTVMESREVSPAAEDHEEYWPFEGEFWRDELGNYEYTLSRACRGE